MIRPKQILTIALCAAILVGCSSSATSPKKPTGVSVPTLKLEEPQVKLEAAAQGSELVPSDQEFREGMTELYPLNDVFLGHCLDGVQNFSVTLLKEAWTGMSLEELTDTVLRIGRRWCTQDFDLRAHPASDGSVRYDITGAKPRDGIRMSFDIDLTASDRQCLDRINAVVDGFIQKYGWDEILVETAIYDWICDHMEYHSFEEFPAGDRRRDACTSAITAFREGWGNCQAYSDLFYIMASRAGLQPGYISGWAGGWHLWNFVWLDKGPSGGGNYMVDVTFGDGTGTHYYLNFGLDRAKDRTWHEDLWAYGFEQYTDDSLTYYGLYSMDHGLAAQTYEDAATFFVWKGRNGYHSAEVLFKGAYGLNKDRLNSAVRDALDASHARGAGQYTTNVMDNGDVVVVFDWTDFQG